MASCYRGFDIRDRGIDTGLVCIRVEGWLVRPGRIKGNTPRLIHFDPWELSRLLQSENEDILPEVPVGVRIRMKFQSGLILC